eukprot:7705089-Pyramimonas_sp.AAC.1
MGHHLPNVQAPLYGPSPHLLPPRARRVAHQRGRLRFEAARDPQGHNPRALRGDLRSGQGEETYSAAIRPQQQQ